MSVMTNHSSCSVHSPIHRIKTHNNLDVYIPQTGVQHINHQEYNYLSSNVQTSHLSKRWETNLVGMWSVSSSIHPKLSVHTNADTILKMLSQVNTSNKSISSSSLLFGPSLLTIHCTSPIQALQGVSVEKRCACEHTRVPSNPSMWQVVKKEEGEAGKA